MTFMYIRNESELITAMLKDLLIIIQPIVFFLFEILNNSTWIINMRPINAVIRSSKPSEKTHGATLATILSLSSS